MRHSDLAPILPYITSEPRRFGDWELVLDPPNDQMARPNLPQHDEQEAA